MPGLRNRARTRHIGSDRFSEALKERFGREHPSLGAAERLEIEHGFRNGSERSQPSGRTRADT